jgi:hypothetical protein
MHIVAFIIVVGFMFYLRRSNRNNVEKYIESKGGELISQEYAPYGKGWLGEDRNRIFKISYRDKQGNLHESWAKTGVFSGVYLSDDTIVELSADHTQEGLEEENKQLKAELERLKKKNYSEQNSTDSSASDKNENQKPVGEDDPEEHPMRISAFSLDEGELIVEQRSTEIRVGDKVFLNNEPAPKGQYKLDFLKHIYVTNGRISSLI